HLHTDFSKPVDFTLHISCVWGTVPNAFAKSKYTTSTTTPLSKYTTSTGHPSVPSITTSTATPLSKYTTSNRHPSVQVYHVHRHPSVQLYHVHRHPLCPRFCSPPHKK
ncbi:unnamed protein product, partial [Staurois parvus]